VDGGEAVSDIDILENVQALIPLNSEKLTLNIPTAI
jgi:hypothetical protein